MGATEARIGGRTIYGFPAAVFEKTAGTPRSFSSKRTSSAPISVPVVKYFNQTAAIEYYPHPEAMDLTLAFTYCKHLPYDRTSLCGPVL